MKLVLLLVFLSSNVGAIWKFGEIASDNVQFLDLKTKKIFVNTPKQPFKKSKQVNVLNKTYHKNNQLRPYPIYIPVPIFYPVYVPKFIPIRYFLNSR